MSGSNFTKEQLEDLYSNKHKSARAIAERFSCSENKVNYWLSKFGIKKRSISDSLYISHNPNGDPFHFKSPRSLEESFLFGLGIGLYWGEGNKRNTNTVRLGNTDPRLVKKFIDFLIHIYGVKKEKFRFGLQVFSDMTPKDALDFWCRALSVSSSQFGKVIITPARSIGTYREKTKHGVLTVYVSNKKLRDLLCAEVEKL